jgi:hypothetical protein
MNDLERTKEARTVPSVRTRIVIWCECGETPENALERHFLSFPEHESPDYEVVVADWCGYEQPV